MSKQDAERARGRIIRNVLDLILSEDVDQRRQGVELAHMVGGEGGALLLQWLAVSAQFSDSWQSAGSSAMTYLPYLADRQHRVTAELLAWVQARGADESLRYDDLRRLRVTHLT